MSDEGSSGHHLKARVTLTPIFSPKTVTAKSVIFDGWW
tara:strand:- start:582 stop:695 length:114 start_codon:yes stop_codon:yes gene_type:complete